MPTPTSVPQRRQSLISTAAAITLSVLAAPTFTGCKKTAEQPVPFLGHSGTSVRVCESVLSWGHSFSMSIDGKTIGTVEEKKLKIDRATTFTLKDPEGKTVASARKKIFTFGTGTAIEVFDAQGHLIGSIEKEVIKSAFSTMGTVYVIKGADGSTQAQSEKTLSTSTKFVLNNPSGSRAFNIQRDFFNVLGDDWTISLYPNDADSRLVAFVPAFKSYADAQK